MTDILYYIFKVSVGIAVFYLTYHFLFKKSKQYVFNRLYLIGSFIASFIIPVITIRSGRYLIELRSVLPADTIVYAETVTQISKPGSYHSISTYLLIVYLIGVAFFITKLIYSCIVAARIKKSSQAEQIKGLNIYVSEDNIRAFTFLDIIIIGKNIRCHSSLIMILLHESVHSKEKHFYDIIMAEVLFSMQWFNPFAWLHKNAIRDNLEFRADDVVIRESDAEEYQLTLLSMVQNRIKLPLFTELNSSNLKKRIIMMKKEKMSRFSGIARFAVIPVFALLIVSLSAKETIIIQDESLTTSLSITDELSSTNDIFQFIARNMRYPTNARETGQIGTVVLFARVNNNGIISEVLTNQPEEDYISFDEFVIVAYSPENVETSESSSLESFISEGRRVINSFPKLGIPEMYGRTIKFQFRFTLENNAGNR